jgi:mannose-1-phosphate guanylyltransferase
VSALSTDRLYVVILAGGKGERFWPLSTPDSPKPFLQFFSDRSLIQQTYDRARKLVPDNRIFLVAGAQHEALCREQLPNILRTQLLLEPAARDTAAAIAYATLSLPPDALMLLLPADHLIPDGDLFAETVKHAADFLASHGGPGTFGIHPTRPDPNYGYIEASPENIGSAEFPIYAVHHFIEKPDASTANEFILKNVYYWNSGMFLWTVSRIQELLARYLPDLWHGIQGLRGLSSDKFAQAYKRLPRISIDYGVMQKCERIFVIPARFEWDDIGTWNSLLRILTVDDNGCLVRGAHIGLDTSNCIVYAENHTIATAGIHDLVIVQRGEQILICKREYADRLKELLAKIPT